MDDVRSATESLLADKPSLEADLEAVLSVDADADSWTFDDVPLDSGTFGELVSQGVVEKDDDGDYRVADRAAVRAALDGDDAVAAEDESGVKLPSLSRASVDRNAGIALAGALLLVVAMRSFPIPSVFRGDAVVLSSNDPYLYRYWVDQLLATSSGPLDLGVLSEMGKTSHGEPLLVAVLWFVSALLGGGQDTAGVVLAVYPIVAAVVVSVLLYLLAVRLTGDRRVGLAAVVMLAATPEHALRTAVGFADHHAFDYLWLLLTAYGLVGALERPDLRGGEGWVATVCVGVGIAGQVLAWEAGPLLILPVGLVVAASTLALVDAGESVLSGHQSILVGTGLGAVLVGLAHLSLGWHVAVVAATPALLFVGTVGVAVLGEAFVRGDLLAGRRTKAFVGVQTLVGVGVVAAMFVVLPDFAGTLSSRLGFLLNAPPIAESQSLFQNDLGLFVAPIFSFGLVLFLALPYLAWVTWRAARVPSGRWFVPVVYGWWFLLLATIQLRFSGELAAFAALFAGLGFVHVAYTVDLTDRVPGILSTDGQRFDGTVPRLEGTSLPLPDRTTVQYAAVILVVLAGIGVLFTPLKIGLTTIGGTEYETAMAIDDHADDQGVEYPENYVFSQWDRNRMYNYFVNGESESYGFAQNKYRQFYTSTDEEASWELLEGRRGFVVTKDEYASRNLSADTVGSRLHEQWGSRNGSADSLARYRAIYASDDGSVKTFQLVPGAVVEGGGDPGETVAVSTDVSVAGTEFTYERQVTTNADGVYRVRVPYAGAYSVESTRFDLTESQVLGNETVGLYDGTGSYWRMNVGEGSVAYDPLSGNHARLSGASWTTRDGQPAVELGSGDRIVAPNEPDFESDDGFMLSTRFRTNDSVDYVEDVPYPRIAMKASKSPFRETDGYQIAMVEGELRAFVGNGTVVRTLYGPRVDDNKWHHVELRWNGSVATLVLDGEQVNSVAFEGSLSTDAPLQVQFPGAIDDLRHVDNTSEASFHSELSTAHDRRLRRTVSLDRAAVQSTCTQARPATST